MLDKLNFKFICKGRLYVFVTWKFPLLADSNQTLLHLKGKLSVSKVLYFVSFIEFSLSSPQFQSCTSVANCWILYDSEKRVKFLIWVDWRRLPRFLISSISMVKTLKDPLYFSTSHQAALKPAFIIFIYFFALIFPPLTTTYTPNWSKIGKGINAFQPCVLPQ